MSKERHEVVHEPFAADAVDLEPEPERPKREPPKRFVLVSLSWAEPDLEAAAVAMRRIHDDAALRAELTATARKLVRERLDVPLPSTPYERFIARPTAEAATSARDVTA